MDRSIKISKHPVCPTCNAIKKRCVYAALAEADCMVTTDNCYLVLIVSQKYQEAHSEIVRDADDVDVKHSRSLKVIRYCANRRDILNMTLY